MNDKPILGVIRICAAGATFDIPYTDDAEFNRVVFATKATDCFDTAGIFVPYRAIDWMIKIPMNVVEAQKVTAGMTKQ